VNEHFIDLHRIFVVQIVQSIHRLRRAVLPKDHEVVEPESELNVAIDECTRSLMNVHSRSDRFYFDHLNAKLEHVAR
jgi:hypothetical protein